MMKHMAYIHGQTELLLLKLKTCPPTQRKHWVLPGSIHWQPVFIEQNEYSLLEVCTQGNEKRVGPGSLFPS